jgi:hypothetical protein
MRSVEEGLSVKRLLGSAQQALSLVGAIHFVSQHERPDTGMPILAELCTTPALQNATTASMDGCLVSTESL